MNRRSVAAAAVVQHAETMNMQRGENMAPVNAHAMTKGTCHILMHANLPPGMLLVWDQGIRSLNHVPMAMNSKAP